MTIDLAFYVSQQVREELISLVGTNPSYLKLTAVLMQHRHIDPDTGFAVVNYKETLEPCAGRVGPDWLFTFAERVGATVLDFKFIPGKEKDSKSRRISVDWIPKHLRDLHWVSLKSTQDCRERWVHVADGTAWVPPTRIVESLTTQEQRAASNVCYDTPDSLFKFSETTVTRTKEVIARMVNEDKKSAAMAALPACVMYKPRFVGTSAGNTYRIFDRYWSSLPTEVLHELTGWVELDLKSTHLAVILRLLEIHCPWYKAPLLRTALLSSDSWHSIINSMLSDIKTGTLYLNKKNQVARAKIPGAGVAMNREGQNRALPPKTPCKSQKQVWGSETTLGSLINNSNYGLVKALVKEATYAELFGMGRQNLREHLLGWCHPNTGEVLPEAVCNIVYKSSFFREINGVQKTLQAFVIKNRGLSDANGKLVCCPHVSNAPTVISKVCSSYELKLLQPAISATVHFPGVHICLWQHDGISVAAEDGADLAGGIAAMCTDVNALAERLRIKTRLIRKND